MRKCLLALLALLFASGLSTAARTQPAPHIAIWKVTGKAGAVYMFGSLHILAPATRWHDPRIGRVVREADTFYFEAPQDEAAVARLIAEEGFLPTGHSLRGILPPKTRVKYDAALTALARPAADQDRLRPWLAQLFMLTLQLKQAGLSGGVGVDKAIEREARRQGKRVRYFETLEQQLALLAPDDPKRELEDFDSFLNDFATQMADVPPMTNAWLTGDEAGLLRMTRKDFAGNDALRKAMIDDRNAAWVKTLKRVLDGEPGATLVVVGAAHLVGEGGVPALLRAAGYPVERL